MHFQLLTTSHFIILVGSQRSKFILASTNSQVNALKRKEEHRNLKWRRVEWWPVIVCCWLRWLAAGGEESDGGSEEQGDEWGGTDGGGGVTPVPLALAVGHLDVLGPSPLHAAVKAALLGAGPHNPVVTLHCKVWSTNIYMVTFSSSNTLNRKSIV